MNIFFKPNFNIIIENNSNMIEVKDNELLKCDNFFGEKLFKVYPQNINSEKKSYLPFLFVLKEKNGSVFSECDKLDIIKIDEYNTLIKINESVVSTNGTAIILASLKTKQKELSILDGTETFVVLRDEDYEILINMSLKINAQKASIFESNGYAIVMCEAQNVFRCFVINIVSAEIVLNEFCHLCEFNTENNILKILKNTKSCTGNGEVVCYGFDENGVKIIDAYCVQLHTPPNGFERELIPFALFFSVKTKNFTLARTFLSENLKETMQNEHLSKFFSGFSEISQNHFTGGNDYILFSPEKNAPAVHLNFIINSQSKIDNIVEI